jgi:DNA-binding NarL/FixJ family response regulator
MDTGLTRISIIEDNEVVRNGLETLIDSIPEFKLSGSFDNCEDAIKTAEYDRPDVILMDIELPGMNGIQGIRVFKGILHEVNIIVITIYEDNEMVFDALCAGACGYITKSADYTELLDAIKEVVNGGAPMSNKIARMVVESFQRNYDTPLSPRETEVLELLAKGKSYSVIADEIFVHKETVKSHIKNIYFKLQVNSKADAIEKALKEKYI